MQMNNRKKEIMQYIQKHMEEYFNSSCRQLQSYVEAHANEIWGDLGQAIDKVLKSVQEVQGERQKGALQYLIFSFLRSGLHQERLKFRIEAYDDNFYLDNRETAGSYQPVFLQERYAEDLSDLYKDAGSKFVRLQGYELLWIKEQYTHYYEAIVYRMIENLSRLIMRNVEESSISVTDDFKIIYGEFMDKAVILYTKEKDKDGVFSD
ncbi:hypothetical protein IMSAGC005_02323 [Lachnospiraceae bacterium]|nr:hypothetical protein IMSAGC005_02323 [Lachnospiraceae bacterium]